MVGLEVSPRIARQTFLVGGLRLLTSRLLVLVIVIGVALCLIFGMRMLGVRVEGLLAFLVTLGLLLGLGG